MTLAVPPDRLDAFLALAERRDVEATVLGTFTDTGALRRPPRRRARRRLDMEFLHDGVPAHGPRGAAGRRRTTPHPRSRTSPRTRRFSSPCSASLNVCSKESECRLYDHEVKGLSVVKPFVGVHRDMPSRRRPCFGSNYGRPDGIVLADGINPFYSDLDTYAHDGIVHRRGRAPRHQRRRRDSVHIAGLDNFCWPDPVLVREDPRRRSTSWPSSCAPTRRCTTSPPPTASPASPARTA